MAMTIAILVSLLCGMLVGATGAAAYVARRTKDPKTARKILRQLYAISHPHWLQASKDDPRRVCPCCGFTEEEADEARRELAGELRQDLGGPPLPPGQQPH